MPEPDNPDETTRLALRTWAARRDELTRQRQDLIATAWRRGDRNIRALAEAADVTRNTIYTDLAVMGLDRQSPIETEET